MSSRAVASSSMTRTRSAVGERRPSEPVELLACASALPGRRTVNLQVRKATLASIPAKVRRLWPEAERKLWLELLSGSFKLIYRGAAHT
jgi:hypothetical protein